MSLEDDLGVQPDANGVYDSPVMPVTAQLWDHWMWHEQGGFKVPFFEKGKMQPPSASVMMIAKQAKDGELSVAGGVMTEDFRNFSASDGYGRFIYPYKHLSRFSIMALFRGCDLEGCDQPGNLFVGQKWLCRQHWHEVCAGTWEH